MWHQIGRLLKCGRAAARLVGFTLAKGVSKPPGDRAIEASAKAKERRARHHADKRAQKWCVALVGRPVSNAIRQGETNRPTDSPACPTCRRITGNTFPRRPRGARGDHKQKTIKKKEPSTNTSSRLGGSLLRRRAAQRKNFRRGSVLGQTTCPLPLVPATCAADGDFRKRVTKQGTTSRW